jgi:hypothetical protein
MGDTAMLSRTCLLALILAASAGISASATTYHVPDPYPTIQSGIDAASTGDTVLVACGTYYEHDIVMESGISLLSETGDADCVTIDAQQQGRVLYCENISENTLIRGFTITGGLLHVGNPGSGGGIYCKDYSSPTFESCTIQDNSALGGGGVFCENHSSPRFGSCVIRDNRSGFVAGGGMLCTNHSSPILNNVAFDSNSTSAIEDPPPGGGLCCEDFSSPQLTDCQFIGNIGDLGSALHCVSGSIALERVIFDSNETDGMRGFGGTLFFIGETATLTDVIFKRNITHPGNATTFGVLVLGCMDATLTRVTFSENDGYGSYAPIIHLSGCTPTMTSCTFYGNDTGLSSVVDCTDGASPVFQQTIIAFNVGWEGMAGPAISCDPSSDAVLECCDIYGNEGGDWVGCIEDQHGVNGNISEDPLFCDPENGDLTLQEDSPCAPFSPPNEECDLIGVWPVGCGPPTATRQTTWGQIKAAYRE